MSRTTSGSLSKLPLRTNDASDLEKFQARQAKRAAKAAERQEKSDKLKEEGNVFFRDGDYLKAADCYQQAILIHGPAAKPVLLTNLAAAYLKLDMYDEAHTAADRALEADPKSVKARFRRGVARRHLERMTAAAIDFRTVLSLDPGNKEAKRELELVEEVLPDCDEYDEDVCVCGECHESDHEAPAPDEDGYLSESMSESSDCEHIGNGVPCKFYNHAGCAKGRECRFSHAPDSQSERDGLGRNVCIYYLMGICKFGTEKCNYTHSKEFLPQKGWWTTPDGIAQAKKIYKVRQMLSQALGLSSHRGKSFKNSSKSKVRKTSKKKSSNGKKKGTSAPVFVGGSVFGLSDLDSEEEEYNEYGFTNSETQELLAQGVKPWDEDAYDVLDVLHNGF